MGVCMCGGCMCAGVCLCGWVGGVHVCRCGWVWVSAETDD